MKKTAIFFIICNLIGWGVLTWTDYLQESKSADYQLFSVAVTPFVMVGAYIVYIVLNKKIHDSWKQKVLEKLIWLGMGTAFVFVVNWLVSIDIWVVKQELTGWDHMLNGIEYGVFGLFFCYGCLIVFIILDMGVSLCKYLRQKRYGNSNNNGGQQISHADFFAPHQIYTNAENKDIANQ